MPISISWYIPDHIVMMAVVGDITMLELTEAYDEALAMVEAGGDIVHTFIDFQNAGDMPRDINQIRSLLNRKSAKSGWSIVVGDNKIVRFIATVITNLLHIHFAYVNTMEEAVEFLRKRYPNLASNS